jgi:hypothetical protein
METGSEIQGPFHLVRCAAELFGMWAVNEVLRPYMIRFADAQDEIYEDFDFGEDDGTTVGA